MTYIERIATRLADAMYSAGFTATVVEEFGQSVGRIALTRDDFVKHILSTECEYVWWRHDDEPKDVWTLIIPENNEYMVSDWTSNERFGKAYARFRNYA